MVVVVVVGTLVEDRMADIRSEEDMSEPHEDEEVSVSVEAAAVGSTVHGGKPASSRMVRKDMDLEVELEAVEDSVSVMNEVRESLSVMWTQ